MKGPRFDFRRAGLESDDGASVVDSPKMSDSEKMVSRTDGTSNPPDRSPTKIFETDGETSYSPNISLSRSAMPSVRVTIKFAELPSSSFLRELVKSRIL